MDLIVVLECRLIQKFCLKTTKDVQIHREIVRNNKQKMTQLSLEQKNSPSGLLQSAYNKVNESTLNLQEFKLKLLRQQAYNLNIPIPTFESE